MYYWVVKHDDSGYQDLMSYREELGTLRQHHIIIEALSPLFKGGAPFALGRRISTERTWRDLNDTLVTYLQSQSVQGDAEQPTLGINIGVDNFTLSWGNSDSNCFSRDNRCVQRSTESEGIVFQIPLVRILGPCDYASLLRAWGSWALLESSSHPGLPNMSVASAYSN
jgi:hypothetical protein